MATDPAPAPEAPKPEEPTIHEAERIPGPDGAVEYGVELTIQQAVERRRRKLDIVVRGPKERKNRHKARQVEEAVGIPVVQDNPHGKTRMSLPHFHQESDDPEGHSFFEAGKRKARRKR
jgi:hypothetical protein